MDIENRLVDTKEETVEEDWNERLGLADISYYI